MSVSCSECLSDLLCGESPEREFSSDGESTAASAGEESIAGFIEDERDFVPGFDYLARYRSHALDASAREESVAWILKVHAHYNFQPLTAYLSVNYLDRFLYSRHLPRADGWPMQLLSVACLSLAAKMEEPLVPSLLDLQVEGAKYVFEPRTIHRMELLVLSVLNWRLRAVTPFSFIDFFACKLDSTGAYVRFLLSRATYIVLSNIRETCFLEYWPSCIAAASVLCAAKEIPAFSLVKPEQAVSWCNGLSRERIISCYQLMQELVVENGKRKPPKVIPHLRVTVRARTMSSDSSSSSSSSPASSYKRRKLNNCLWVDEDDDKGSSG